MRPSCIFCQDTAITRNASLDGRPGSGRYEACRDCSLTPDTAPNYRRVGGGWRVKHKDHHMPADLVQL